jgi:hypothetical protein
MWAPPGAAYGRSMSMTEPTRQQTPRRPEGVFLGADSSPSWTMFAGFMIGLLAVMNLIYGIAAVSSSSFFVGDVQYVLSDLKTWGWVLIVVSALQAATAVGVMAQVELARWAGVAVMSVNAIVQLIVFPAYPWWAGMLFAVDILVIYALIAHGSRRD